MREAQVREALASALGAEVRALTRVHGGDVAISFRAELSDGRTCFAKTHTNPPPGFFSTEARGLAWLREARTVLVPEVLAVSDDPPLLALEWIEEGPPRAQGEADFGRQLAALHGSGAPCFGREDGRTTGSRRLPNGPCADWCTFYAERRLRPLARLAADGRALPGHGIRALESIANRLVELAGPEEPPARLHGDLWGGNRLVDRAGRSWLIDPAAHGGHREFDLAMMRLFGGFSEDCFAGYAEVAPLAPGWRERVALHQLAPLVVHAIKFGGGYVGSALDALDSLSRTPRPVR